MYARGINDEALNPENDQFLHIVSCNTHNIAALLKTVGTTNDEMQIENGRFLCLRRANDISQDGSFVPAPQAGKHSDVRFGTHHARDAHHIFETLDKDLNLFSSAIKLNTQYMHSLHSRSPPASTPPLKRSKRNSRESTCSDDPQNSANTVFSFGREHGHYGRILNHNRYLREDSRCEITAKSSGSASRHRMKLTCHLLRQLYGTSIAKPWIKGLTFCVPPCFKRSENSGRKGRIAQW